MKILSKVMSKGTLRANWPILTSDHYTKPLTSMWSNLVTTCNKARQTDDLYTKLGKEKDYYKLWAGLRERWAFCGPLISRGIFPVLKSWLKLTQ